MNILILNIYYFPNIAGGAEVSVKLLAEGLARRGHNVSVVTLDGKSKKNMMNPDLVNGVNVYRCYSKSIYRRRVLGQKKYFSDFLLNGIHSIKNARFDRDIKKIICAVKPDVIHTNNLVSMSYAVLKIAHKNNIPIVHTLRDYWLLDPSTTLINDKGFLIMIFRLLCKAQTNNRINVLTAPSRRVLDIFEERGYFVGISSKVVYNCVDFSEEILKRNIESKLNREEQIIKLLYVGTIAESKGIKILVKAFLNSGLENVSLTMCGTGSLVDWVREKDLNNKIRLVGKVEHDKINMYYEEADVMIVPSLWEEPFGRVVIEAAQYGLPIIGSDRGGIPEIIDRIQFGEYYKASDENMLIRLLYKYSNRKNIKDIIKKGPQNMSDFSLEKQLDDFSCIYRSICKNGVYDEM